MSNKTAFDFAYKRARSIQSEATSLCEPQRMNVPTTVICYAAGRIEELEASETAARIACADAENDFKVLTAAISRKTGMSVEEVMKLAFPNREW